MLAVVPLVVDVLTGVVVVVAALLPDVVLCVVLVPVVVVTGVVLLVLCVVAVVVVPVNKMSVQFSVDLNRLRRMTLSFVKVFCFSLNSSDTIFCKAFDNRVIFSSLTFLSSNFTVIIGIFNRSLV